MVPGPLPSVPVTETPWLIVRLVASLVTSSGPSKVTFCKDALPNPTVKSPFGTMVALRRLPLSTATLNSVLSPSVIVLFSPSNVPSNSVVAPWFTMVPSEPSVNRPEARSSVEALPSVIVPRLLTWVVAPV